MRLIDAYLQRLRRRPRRPFPFVVVREVRSDDIRIVRLRTAFRQGDNTTVQQAIAKSFREGLDTKSMASALQMAESAVERMLHMALEAERGTSDGRR